MNQLTPTDRTALAALLKGVTGNTAEGA
jgi:hypothetical protein